MTLGRAASTLALVACALQSAPLGAAPRVAPRPRTASATPESVVSAPAACTDVRTGASLAIHARRLTPSGSIDSAWTPAAGDGCTNPLQRNVVSDDSGGVFVGWVDGRRGDSELYLQHLDGAGQAAEGWPVEGRRLRFGNRSQYQLAVIGDGNGGTYLAWQDYRSDRFGRVFVQHLSAVGMPHEGWPATGLAITDTLCEQSWPQLALDGAGGVLVSWQDRRSSRLNVYLQRITAVGRRAVGWPVNGLRVGEAEVENRA